MSIIAQLNRFQVISEKIVDNERPDKKDLEYVEKNINICIRTLEIELQILYDLKLDLEKSYQLNLKN
jgi:hypothetical protein